MLLKRVQLNFHNYEEDLLNKVEEFATQNNITLTRAIKLILLQGLAILTKGESKPT